jgi:hypothetical protein
VARAASGGTRGSRQTMGRTRDLGRDGGRNVRRSEGVTYTIQCRVWAVVDQK